MGIFDRLAQRSSETQSQSDVTACYRSVTATGNTETRINSGCYRVTGVTPPEAKSNLVTPPPEQEETEKNRLEKENMKCCKCNKWKEIDFLRGLCLLTNTETSVKAYCRQIKKWP